MKSLLIVAIGFTFLFLSCRAAENPSQIGNRGKLDLYHRQKQVR